MKIHNLFLVLPLLLALVVAIACDGDNGREVRDDDLGDELDVTCGTCPCDFFSIPMDNSCWVALTVPFPFLPSFISSIADDACGFENIALVMGVEILDGKSICQITPLGGQPCDFTLEDLSEDEWIACRCVLEEYATAMNKLGFVANDPPYICPTPSQTM